MRAPMPARVRWRGCAGTRSARGAAFSSGAAGFQVEQESEHVAHAVDPGDTGLFGQSALGVQVRDAAAAQAEIVEANRAVAHEQRKLKVDLGYGGGAAGQDDARPVAFGLAHDEDAVLAARAVHRDLAFVEGDVFGPAWLRAAACRDCGAVRGRDGAGPG